MKRCLAFLLFFAANVTFGQSATDLANGTSFANSIAPKSASQVVNPSGVSASAWGTQTSAPTAVPSGLGGFSSPNTDSTLLNTAKSSSLTAMGNQTMINCASFVPGSDPYQNQACAAVNFLNNQCMQATTGEKSVLGNSGIGQGSSSNCAGTYGAGSSQFGYGNTVTISDPMFTGTLGLATSASLGQTCTTQTVVTQPAQYATNTCIISTDEEDDSCSQYLNTSVTKSITESIATDSCQSGGSLQNGTCVQTENYAPTISCPAGYVQGANNTCVDTSTLAGTPYCPSGTTAAHTDTGSLLCQANQTFPSGPPATYEGMVLELAYLNVIGIYLPLQSCPAGYTFDGSQCTETITTGLSYSCPSGGSLQGQTCVTTTTTSVTVTYSCPSGQTLSGTNCITQTLSTSWSDTCGIYETSAGVSLGTPQN
jgi:hypothetical protein